MIVGIRRAALAAALLVCCQPASAAGPTVGVELDDGTRVEGQLGGIAVDAIEIAASDGATQKVPVARVRTIGRVPPAAGGAAADVRLTLIDGTTIGGTDFSTSGGSGTLAVAEGRVELPVARVRAVEWLAAAPAARWLDAVPEGATSDLIVVAKGDGFEMVECAITAIGPETVTVVLDEETIPVKRSKVIGARWLRDGQAVATGRTLVDVTGGTLRADSVAWTPDGLVLDGADPDRRVTLPAAALQRVDYAAGRITPLATLPPEKLDVEPFFGTLADVPGLAGYFAPRPMAVDGQARRPDLLVRPRTVGVWRIPAQARRFRAGLKQVSGTGAAVVIVTVDERRVLEQVVSGGDPLPVDVDLAGGRRLGVTVDFPPGGLPGSVRLVEPVIEQ